MRLPLYWNVCCGSNIFAHHKVTKDNSSSKVTLHTCANVQPGATTVAWWPPKSIVPFPTLKCKGNSGEKLNAPLFGFKALCLPKDQIPSLQTIYLWDQRSLLYLHVEHIKKLDFPKFDFGLECLPLGIKSIINSLHKVRGIELLYQS